MRILIWLGIFYVFKWVCRFIVKEVYFFLMLGYFRKVKIGKNNVVKIIFIILKFSF